jgi:hypothetical protein
MTLSSLLFCGCCCCGRGLCRCCGRLCLGGTLGLRRRLRRSFGRDRQVRRDEIVHERSIAGGEANLHLAFVSAEDLAAAELGQPRVRDIGTRDEVQNVLLPLVAAEIGQIDILAHLAPGRLQARWSALYHRRVSQGGAQLVAAVKQIRHPPHEPRVPKEMGWLTHDFDVVVRLARSTRAPPREPRCKFESATSLSIVCRNQRR